MYSLSRSMRILAKQGQRHMRSGSFRTGKSVLVSTSRWGGATSLAVRPAVVDLTYRPVSCLTKVTSAVLERQAWTGMNTYRHPTQITEMGQTFPISLTSPLVSVTNTITRCVSTTSSTCLQGMKEEESEAPVEDPRIL
ncbi:hypothetical protein IWQ62_005071, partial [Dispira parvispora]